MEIVVDSETTGADCDVVGPRGKGAEGVDDVDSISDDAGLMMVALAAFAGILIRDVIGFGAVTFLVLVLFVKV